jgi:hypothetical protein
MKKIKTIGDLKDYLNDVLFELEDYDDEEEVKVRENTYHLTNKNHFLATPWGFVDLGNPCDLEECEYCGERFNKKDMILKHGVCACRECFELYGEEEDE